MQKGVPVPWFWLDKVHTVKVEIGHHVVLCITSYIDDLHKEKAGNETFRCQLFKKNVCFGDVTVTLQFCSQKDLGRNWTGRWVLMRRGVVVSRSAASLPAMSTQARYLVLSHLVLVFSRLFGFLTRLNRMPDCDLTFGQTAKMVSMTFFFFFCLLHRVTNSLHFHRMPVHYEKDFELFVVNLTSFIKCNYIPLRL